MILLMAKKQETHTVSRKDPEDRTNEIWQTGYLLERQLAVRIEEVRLARDINQKQACEEAFPWVEEGSRQKSYANLMGEGRYRDKPARLNVTHLYGIARFLGKDPHTLLAEIEYDIREGRIRTIPDSSQKAGARKRAATRRKHSGTQQGGPQLEIL